MGRTPKNGLYGLCFALGQTLGLRVTKTQYTNLIPGDLGGAYWTVHSLGFKSNAIRRMDGTLAPGTLGFNSLGEVLRYLQDLKENRQPTPTQDNPTPTEPTPAPAPESNVTPEAMERAAQAAIEQARDALESRIETLVREEVSKRVKPEPIEIKLPGKTETVSAGSGEHKQFPELLAELAMGNGIRLVGPAGTGKTTMAENAAKLLGWKVYVIPPPQEAHELLGYRDASGNYQDTPFYRAVCETDPTLIVFDEMDRADARALTVAHTVLAGNGTVNFPHETRSVLSTLARVGTLNTWGLGADSEFVGAGKLDGATLSRFPTILYIDYDTELEEHIAVSRYGGTPETVKEALAIRDRLRSKGIRVTWTPRDTFAHCIRRFNGVSREDSLKRSLLACLKPDQYSSVINGGY